MGNLLTIDKIISDRKYYFVDYDSVKQSGLEGIENLFEKDKVIIFYKLKFNSMELSFFEKMHCSKAEINLYKISDENDFNIILASYLGYIMGMKPNSEYYIISKDNAFKSLKTFWTEKGIEIDIYNDIKSITE